MLQWSPNAVLCYSRAIVLAGKTWGPETYDGDILLEASEGIGSTFVHEPPGLQRGTALPKKEPSLSLWWALGLVVWYFVVGSGLVVWH